MNIDERLEALAAKTKEMAESQRRNSTAAVYLFLENVVVPELRIISQRLDQLQTAMEKNGSRNMKGKKVK